MLRTAGSSPYPEKIFQRAIPVPTRSAGSIRSDCPMPYQLNSWPPRPCSPNSGYSLGKTCGSEVHSQCVVCSRCMVSAVPSSPDCTTNANRLAARQSNTRGSASQRESRGVLPWMLKQSHPQTSTPTASESLSFETQVTHLTTSFEQSRFVPDFHCRQGRLERKTQGYVLILWKCELSKRPVLRRMRRARQ